MNKHYTKSEVAIYCGVRPCLFLYYMDHGYIIAPTTLVGCEYCYTEAERDQLAATVDEWRAAQRHNVSIMRLAAQCNLTTGALRSYIRNGLILKPTVKIIKTHYYTPEEAAQVKKLLASHRSLSWADRYMAYHPDLCDQKQAAAALGITAGAFGWYVSQGLFPKPATTCEHRTLYSASESEVLKQIWSDFKTKKDARITINTAAKRCSVSEKFFGGLIRDGHVPPPAIDYDAKGRGYSEQQLTELIPLVAQIKAEREKQRINKMTETKRKLNE